MWNIFLKFIDLRLLIIILVSSAKIIVLDLLFMTLGKSLMYKRKSRGPSIEP
jgi:hypothetical protein